MIIWRAMRIYRWFLLLCLVFFLRFGTLAGQQNTTVPASELPKDPAAVFALVEPFYNFSDPSLKPWHLKATYQLYDEAGKQPTEQGNYEYWWASPTMYRSTWTRGASTHTDWHTADGKHAYASTGGGLNFFEYRLQADLLSPLPEPKDYDTKETYFDREMIAFGKVKVPCIMIVPKMPQRGQIQTVPLGLFPTYCFDPKIPVLIAETSFGSLMISYGDVVRIQNRNLAKYVGESEAGRKVLTATVEKVEGLNPADPALVPPPDAKADTTGPVTIGSAVIQGNRIGGPMPIYPQDAKEARAEGKVVLQALIGRDGRIHNLKVVSAPYPSLVESALWAVSRWEYKPYLLNGDPVDVETQIDVIYSLGG
jgi:TonB family protein